MAHADRDPDSSVAYIDEVFEDYKHYAGVSRFYGRVAEVGPGDNCGVALRFLGDGCECIDLVDRFYAKRDMRKQSEIYKALLERHPSLKNHIRVTSTLEEEPFPNIRRYYGADAAAEEFFHHHQGYDFIVSRAVLEHVYDPRAAIETMARALNPSGMLLHKVDLRDHEMFSRYAHELRFLEVPDWLYSKMVGYAGRPNRVLVDQYRAVLREIGLDYQILVTRLAKVGDICPHVPYEHISPDLKQEAIAYVRSVRKHFARSLLSLSDADLSVAGIFIVARDRRERN